MNLLINNQLMWLDEGATLTQAINQFAADGQFAVALNGEFVAKQDYQLTQLTGGDKIEILSPIAGG